MAESFCAASQAFQLVSIARMAASSAAVSTGAGALAPPLQAAASEMARARNGRAVSRMESPRGERVGWRGVVSAS